MNNIEISISTLSFLNKIGRDITNDKFNNFKKHQGLVYAYQSNSTKTTHISLCYSLNLDENWDDVLKDKFEIISEYVKNAKMDFVLCGLFFVTERYSLTKQELQFLLKMNMMNNNSLFLFFNPTTESLSVKKLSDEIIQLNLEAHYKSYQDYPIELHNMCYTSHIFEDCKYKEKYDNYALYSAFQEKDIIDDVTYERSNETINNKL